MHEIRYKGFCFFVFMIKVLCFQSVIAQKRDFVHCLNSAKLMYTAPVGFTEMDSVKKFFFYTNHEDKYKQKYLYPFTYRIISNRDNVLIAFVLLPLKNINDTSAVIQRLFPGFNRNKTYLGGIRHVADTLNDKVIHYSKEKSRKIYNADNAGTYGFNLEIPYEGEYNKCKAVFMHKEDVGDADVFYFYNESSRHRIKKFIKKTPKMLRFKD